MFRKALMAYRKKNGLSQEEMVEQLADMDASLESLDRVTYSRWERGITSPSMHRKYIILKRLYLYDALFSELAESNKSKVAEQQDIVNKRFASSSLATDHFYHSNNEVKYVLTSSLEYDEFEFFSLYGKQVFDHELSYEASLNFEEGCLLNAFYSFYNELGVLSGHAFFHILDIEHLSLLVPELSDDKRFVGVEKILFVGSSFTASKNMFLAASYLLKNVLLEYPDIEYIYARAFNESIFKFYQVQSAMVVDRSESTESGIAYKNKQYKWIGVMIPIDDFFKNNALVPKNKPCFLMELGMNNHQLPLSD
ncbi:MAG: helix-turn-helix domain-containing protein [Vibrio sp.]